MSITASVYDAKSIYFILVHCTNTIEARSLYKDQILSKWTCIPDIVCFDIDQKSHILIAACGFGTIALVNFYTQKLEFSEDAKMIRGIHCDLALKVFVNPFSVEKSTVYIGLMFLRKIYK
jgi:hypothetical protein